MAISIEDFEGGFRALCAAFGTQFSEQRMLVYHGALSPRINQGRDQWRRVVNIMVTSMANMPKLVEILNMSDFRDGKAKEQSLQSWVTDICKVKDCYDGFVSREIKGFSVLFACPLCDRHNTNMFPVTAIPTAKKWQGKYEAYTEDEMGIRKKERQQVVDAMRNQAARKIEFENWEEQADTIGGPF